MANSQLAQRPLPAPGEVLFDYQVEQLLAAAHKFDVPAVFALTEAVVAEEPRCRLAMLMDPLRWLLACDGACAQLRTAQSRRVWSWCPILFPPSSPAAEERISGAWPAPLLRLPCLLCPLLTQAAAHRPPPLIFCRVCPPGLPPKGPLHRHLVPHSQVQHDAERPPPRAPLPAHALRGAPLGGAGRQGCAHTPGNLSGSGGRAWPPEREEHCPGCARRRLEPAPLAG